MNYARLSKQEIDELNKSILNLYPDFEVISHSKNTTRAATNLAEITSVLPQEISAGTNSDLTIRGTGFGNNKGSVGFLNANDGGAIGWGGGPRRSSGIWLCAGARPRALGSFKGYSRPSNAGRIRTS